MEGNRCSTRERERLREKCGREEKRERERSKK